MANTKTITSHLKTHHNFMVSLDLATYEKLQALAAAMNRPVKNQAEFLIQQCFAGTKSESND
jgi:hypothetical protein